MNYHLSGKVASTNEMASRSLLKEGTFSVVKLFNSQEPNYDRAKTSADLIEQPLDSPPGRSGLIDSLAGQSMDRITIIFPDAIAGRV